MLGTVKSKSMGLLSLEPKQANGTPVTDFADCILCDANGNELKEWVADDWPLSNLSFRFIR